MNLLHVFYAICVFQKLANASANVSLHVPIRNDSKLNHQILGLSCDFSRTFNF